MRKSRNAGYWLYWLFLYGIATIPAALFAGIMASSYIYVYDHAHRLSNYYTILHGGEAAAAVACAAPGFVWVGVSQLKDQREEKGRLLKQQVASTADDTVWPPPPQE